MSTVLTLKSIPEKHTIVINLLTVYLAYLLEDLPKELLLLWAPEMQAVEF